MIADRHTGITTTSTMTGKSYAAGIDDANMAWVIEQFTDLYSDEEMACIREYSTNARDAQIEAGYTGPIEVSLPNGMSPFLSIRDHGIGLSETDIGTVYSRYGSSTKRDSNDFNGMLGFGCKSALAYASSFTVESVKDGIKTLLSVTRVDSGVPEFQIVHSGPSDEDNGTVVRIPVKRANAFAAKAKKFYQHWPAGSVLVNGVQPSPMPLLDLGERTIETDFGSFEVNLGISEYQEGLTSNQIVMGGVAYPSNFYTRLPYRRRVVAYVSMGAVDFTPAREGLRETPKTKATVAAIQELVPSMIAAAVERHIAGSASPFEAVALYRANRDLVGALGTAQVAFKGVPIPKQLQIPARMTSFSGDARGANRVYDPIATESTLDAYVIKNFTLGSLTGQHKKRVQQYVEQHATLEPKGRLVFTSLSSIDTEWVDPACVIDWEEVKKVKMPRAAAAPRTPSDRPVGSYDGYMAGDRHSTAIQAADIPSEKLYYCEGTKHRAWLMRPLIGGEKVTIVALPRTRVAKFLRTFPHAKYAYAEVFKAYEEFDKALTANQRLALALDKALLCRVYAAFDPKRIDDPEMRRWVELSKLVGIDTLANQSTRFSDLLNKQPELPELSSCPLDKYRLLTYNRYNVPRSIDEHVYLYINAVHAADNA